jgi:hypothetical protein
MAHKEVEVFSMTGEVDNRVSDQLPWTVEGNIAPPFDLPNLNPPRLQNLLVTEEMLALRASTEGDHRRMFDEQEAVLHLASYPRRGALSLKLERLPVVYPSEPVHLELSHYFLSLPIG